MTVNILLLFPSSDMVKVENRENDVPKTAHKL